MKIRACYLAKYLFVVLLFGHAVAASSAPYTIPFTLANPGRVSMNIYNAQGNIVRELLHAAQRPAGGNIEFWDGLDNNGSALAAGTYSWKLLTTPSGLKADYLMSPGGSFTPGDRFWAQEAGCHGGPFAVTADATGVYIGASGTENVEVGTFKQSLDGSTRLWSQTGPEAWVGDIGLASANGKLYVLTNNGKVFVYDTTTGEYQTRYVVPTISLENGNVVNGAIAANGSTLVVASEQDNWVKFLDPANGNVNTTAWISAPKGVAVDGNGTVFVTTGTKIVKVTRTNPTPVDFITGITSPQRLAVDASGFVFVAEAGSSQQVKRYNSSGTLLNTYGANGGRRDGIYVATNFLKVTDIAADGSGGFFVTEQGSAPRRVARFDVNGNLIKEWYGGQQWSPWIAPEPPTTAGSNPPAIWVMSAWGTFMRCTVDWTTNTWQVHSTYTQDGLADGLVKNSGVGERWVARRANGNLYLCMERGYPLVLRVDTTNWKLYPAVVGEWSASGYPTWLQSALSSTSNGFLWTDENGDGRPLNSNGTVQSNEIVNAGFSGWSFSNVTVDDNMNNYVTLNNAIYALPVEGFNSCGAPLYGNFPHGDPPVTVTWPGRDQGGGGRWHTYAYHDAATNTLYAGINSNIPAFGLSDDAFVQKWDGTGAEVWAVGRKWNNPQNEVGNPVRPGTINAFRHFVGATNGCIVLNDFNGGAGPHGGYVWDQDGLWVGSPFEECNLDGVPGYRYRLCDGDSNIGQLFTNTNTGDVLLFSSWINAGRVYRITGWDGWTRQNGTVTVGSGGSASHVGQGLRAEYYNNRDLTSLATTKVESTAINYNWGTSKPDSAMTGNQNYSVRWTGQLKVPYGPKYSGMMVPGPWSPYAGSWCEFTFRGTSVQFVSRKYGGGGRQDIYLDGVFQQTVDAYSSTDVENAILFQTSGLSYADHVLRIVNNPTKNQQSWSTAMNFCGFYVDGTFYDPNGVTYTFNVNHNDGAALFIDRKLVINDWNKAGGATSSSGTVRLLQGQSAIQLDYASRASPSAVALSWSSPFFGQQVIPVANLFPGVSNFNPATLNLSIPGVIECEHFGGDGEGVSYHSITPGNSPSYISGVQYPADYRPGTAADVIPNCYWQAPEVDALQSGNFSVQGKATEWFAYPMTVAQAGTYTVSVNVTNSNANPAGTFHLEIDGVNISGTLTTPICSPTSPYQVVSVTGVNLTAGPHTLKLVCDSDSGNICGGFDSITFVRTDVSTVASPIFGPVARTFSSAQSVTMSTATSGASIRYTTDGSTPTSGTGTVYSAPVLISGTATLKAIAYKSGAIDSAVTTGTYTITNGGGAAASPTFSPAAGTYTAAQSVSISTTTSGASIRYTIDGSTPTSNFGTVYSQPVSVTSPTTLKAVTYKGGMTDSAVAVASYTVGSGIVAARIKADSAAQGFRIIRYTESSVSTPSVFTNLVLTAPSGFGSWNTSGIAPTSSSGLTTLGFSGSGFSNAVTNASVRADALTIGSSYLYAQNAVFTIGPLQAESYLVRLYFSAEYGDSTSFGVKVNGVTVATNPINGARKIDIEQVTGVTPDGGGNITVSVERNQSNVLISGIDVIPMPGSSVAVTGVTVTPASASIAVNGGTTLIATIAPGTATNKGVTWSSSNAFIATVNSAGVVTGISAGTATITATSSDGSFTATSVITVTPNTVAVTGVTVAPTSISIPVNGSTTLTATIAPGTATNKGVTWSSSNVGVATVSSAGVVTGISAGTATITVTTSEGGFNAARVVTVTPNSVAVTGVTIAPTSASIEVNGSTMLAASIAPSNATNKGATWSTSNAAVATVSSLGVVTGTSAGTATITVTTSEGGFTSTSIVTVANAITGGMIAARVQADKNANGFKVIRYTSSTVGTPSVFTDFTVAAPSGYGSWNTSGTTPTTSSGLTTLGFTGSGFSSAVSNDAIKADAVTIGASYLYAQSAVFTVGPFSAGKYLVQLYFSAEYGDNTSFNVNVNGSTVATNPISGARQLDIEQVANVTPDGSGNFTVSLVGSQSKGLISGFDIIPMPVVVTGVLVAPESASISVNGSTTLTAIIAPSTATNKGATWSSSNAGVATVSSTGVVTGISAGTATITVTTSDGSFSDTSVVTVTPNTVAVTGVSVSPTSASIAVNGSTTLTATIAPSTATYKGATWSSSNAGVATVSSAGVVIGISAGTATITVTTSDGGFTATSAVTVLPPVLNTKRFEGEHGKGSIDSFSFIDESASGGEARGGLYSRGAYVEWSNVPPSSGFTIAAFAPLTTTLGVFIDGVKKATLTIPAAVDWNEVPLVLAIPAGATLRLQREVANGTIADIDYIDLATIGALGATAFKTINAVNINGSLAESVWTLNTSVAKTISGSSNNGVTFGTLWDANYLYIGVKVLDATIRTNRPGITDNDSVEIHLDGNFNKGTTYDAADLCIIKQANARTIWTSRPVRGLLHGRTAISRGYTVEIAIPWSALGGLPAAGAKLGLDVQVNDNDFGLGATGRLIWNGDAGNATSTVNFGEVTISPGVAGVLVVP